MAFHTVKHHYSYKSDDCTSTLMAKILIFPDSSTAKRYSCARTKIEATVNNVLAPVSVQYVLSLFRHVHNVQNNISKSALHRLVCIIATLLKNKSLTNSIKFILIVTLRHNTGKSYKTKAKQKLQKQSKAKVTKKTQKQQIKFIFKIQPMNTLRFPLLLPIRNDHF